MSILNNTIRHQMLHYQGEQQLRMLQAQQQANHQALHYSQLQYHGPRGIETMGSHLGSIDKFGNYPQIETKKEKISMLKEVSNDVKLFIREHKSMIYWILVLLTIDHFFFHGSFKEKLKEIMNKLVGKVEDKVHGAIDGNKQT